MSRRRLVAGARKHATFAATLWTAVVLAVAMGAAASATDRRVMFHIDEQPLGAALNTLALQADLEVLFSPELVEDLTSSQVEGEFTPAEAVQILLEDTGLTYEFTKADTLLIRAMSTPPAEEPDPEPVRGHEDSSGTVQGSGRSMEGNPGNGNDPPVEQDSTQLQGREAEEEGASSAEDVNPRIEAERQKFTGEITVTSTRRELKVREVPASVSVTEGWELESIGATTMDDYAQQVAGVNYLDDAPQRDSVTIRGITTSIFPNQTQAPVAIYVDEIPLTDYFFYYSNFDVMPFDLERVEFLKGPQGTLYGSASLGGSIRYMLNRPDLDRNGGALNLTASSTASGGTNYLAQGMFNAVLASGRFALRGVLSYEDDAGWIDHETQGENYNHYTQANGRLMASWTPNDGVRLDGTFMYQTSDVNATNNTLTSPDFDDPYTSAVFKGTPQEFDQWIANLKLTWDLGFADFMSSTSFLEKGFQRTTDYGTVAVLDFLTTQEFLLGIGFGLPIDFGDLSSRVHQYLDIVDPSTTSSTLFQEFRLVSRDIGRLDWIVGLFYADADTDFTQTESNPGIEDAVNELAPPFGSLLYPNDAYLYFNMRSAATELAVYGELGIDLSNRWKLTAGGRYTDFERVDPTYATLYGQDFTVGETPFNMNVFSPKVSLAYRPDSDLLWYGLVTRGYRTGGTNITYSLVHPDPNDPFRFFDTDDLWDYETGIKKTWAGGAVSTDLTLFYLDWSDIQLDGTFYYNAGLVSAIFNTGKAHSAGVEAVVSARLAPGLTLQSAITWNEAELDEDTPPLIDPETNLVIILPAGSRLPASPEWSTASTLQYAWNNRSLGFPYVALDHFYKDTYVTFLVSQRSVPSFNLWTLRAGTTLAKHVQLTLAVRNLLDERAPTIFQPSVDGNFIPDVYPETWRITRPRTISLTFQKRF